MTNSPWLSHYPESRFGGFSRVDGTVLFFARVNALLKDDATVVDIGCGKGRHVNAKSTFKSELRVLKGKCARVIGIDVDESAAGNPVVDEFRLIEDSRWPLKDDSVDFCIAHYVLEHVQFPIDFFAECKRILKPGGIMCIRTPNAWGYPALAARLVPNKWHLKVLRRLSDGQREDAYPTYFRCNTTRKIRLQLCRYDFRDSCVFTLRGCEFFKFSTGKDGQIVGEALKLVHEHEHNEYEHDEHGSLWGFGQASVSTGRTAADRVEAAVAGSNAAGGAYGSAGVGLCGISGFERVVSADSGGGRARWPRPHRPEDSGGLVAVCDHRRSRQCPAAGPIVSDGVL